MMEGIVEYGSLKGLRLSEEAWWGAPDMASMLLGLYEHELLMVLCTDPLSKKSNYIDIGAAVGLNIYKHRIPTDELN
jgi:hypothetical protein